MDKYPAKIKFCPIQEAVFEIRFSSFLPSQAVFGITYQTINKHFSDSKLIQLPILQLPEAVRQSDPNLVYQPLHRLQKGNLSISIGPKVISFANQAPYIGWTVWKEQLLTILSAFVEAGICHKIERSGLRYINILKVPLFDATNTKIQIINDTLTSQSTTMRTEIKKEAETIIMQLSNNVNVAVNNASFLGSVIDIDVLIDLNIDNAKFGEKMDEILNTSHTHEKELFFKLLKPDFLSTLEPLY